VVEYKFTEIYLLLKGKVNDTMPQTGKFFGKVFIVYLYSAALIKPNKLKEKKTREKPHSGYRSNFMFYSYKQIR
jgi:hypothetical protein